MRRSLWVWVAVSLISSAGVAVVVFADVGSRLRPFVVLWFVVVCPGMAIVRLLPVGERLAELTLAVAVSLALGIIVPGTMLYAGFWSPEIALAILISITLIGTIVEIVRSWSRRYHPRRP